MALTNIEIRNTREPGKMTDGRGLYLLVKDNSSKLWRYDYRFAGKRRTLALGQYPAVKLGDARRTQEEARRQLDKGIDPSEERRQAKVTKLVMGANTFGLLAREYMDRLRKLHRSEETIEKIRMAAVRPGRLFERPSRHQDHLRRNPSAVAARRKVRTPRDGQKAPGSAGCRVPVGDRDAARRARPDAASQKCPAPGQHNTAGGPTEETAFGRLLASIERYNGWPPLRSALQFLALTFVRPGELRLAESTEIEGDMWRIPAERMKMRRPHDVPLPRQALAILERTRPFSGNGQFIFPGRDNQRPLGHNAMNVALRRMGYGRQDHTAHGFRSSASTILNERGYRHDVIEAQLAHIEPNEVRRVYNRAKYWPERVALMRDWADLCDRLRRQDRDHSDLI